MVFSHFHSFIVEMLALRSFKLEKYGKVYCFLLRKKIKSKEGLIKWNNSPSCIDVTDGTHHKFSSELEVYVVHFLFRFVIILFFVMLNVYF